MTDLSFPNYLSSFQAMVSLQTQAKFIDTPRLIVSDFDGTLFTPDLRIISEILHHNKRLRIMLRQKHIPLIINTGRSKWSEKAKQDAKILGIYPDVIIVGGGTMIYHKTVTGEWITDTRWKTILDNIEVGLPNQTITWGSDTDTVESYIDQAVKTWQAKQKVYLEKIEGTTLQIRYMIRNVESIQLPTIIFSLKKQFLSGIKVIYAESMFSNRFGFPTGEIMIIPDCAGKDNALKYLFDQYMARVNKPIEAFCFGDGAVDLTSFLCMPSTTNYILKQFLINPTTLAENLFTTTAFISSPKLLSKSGAEAILSTLEEKLAVTQNNVLRKYISEPSKYLLDKMYPVELSANEITLIGLLKIIEAVDAFYEKNVFPGKVFLQYIHGLFADVADGIRARQTFVTKQGQLADDFVDRVREFYQLYVRGERRLHQQPEQSLITFEAAISCILTGLMRRQAELKGLYFNEGATLWRTKELFLSLVYDTMLNQHKKSILIDEKILKVSEAIYLERLQKAGSFNLDAVANVNLSPLEKKTLERWLLYVQLLQEEHILVLNTLPKHMHKTYQKWLNAQHLEYYLEVVNVQKARKAFGFKDYRFSLNNYNQYFHKWNRKEYNMTATIE